MEGVWLGKDVQGRRENRGQWGLNMSSFQTLQFHLGNLSIFLALPPSLRLSWRTAAERISMSVRLPEAASSSPSSFVRSYASESPVSYIFFYL